MSQFFLFWDQIASGTAYSFFGFLHCIEIALIPLTLLLTGWWLKKQSHLAQQRLLLILALAVPVVEGLRIIWLVSLGEGQWFKLLPLHLCGTQVLFIPLAILTKKQVLQDYIWSTSIIGGITAIVYPTGIVGTYPFFHFQTFQSLLLHLLLILVPFMMWQVIHYRPQPKNFPKVMGILFLCAACALFVDVVWGQNYMFLIEIPQVFPLTWIFSTFGYVGYWLTLAITLGCGCALALHIPAKIQEKLDHDK